MTTQEFTIVLIAMGAVIALGAAIVTAFFLHGKRNGYSEDTVMAAFCMLFMYGAVALTIIAPLIDRFT